MLKVPDIKLDAYLICLFASNVQMESAYVSLSLGFDSCAFAVIVVSAFKTRPPSRENKFKLTGIVGTLVQDATIYFVMIFTSHLTLTMFIFSARVCCAAIFFITCHRVLQAPIFLQTGNLEANTRIVSPPAFTRR